MTGLPMWVVYDHPNDYPEGCVARYWAGTSPTSTVICGPTVAVVRRQLRAHDPNLVAFTRGADDDPAIVEVWL